MHLQSSLESRIDDISYSVLPSTSTRGGGDCIRSGMELGVAGLSIETWNTVCTERMAFGSQRVKEWVLACAIMVKGPKYFSASFLEGCVVQKNCARTKTCCPTLKSGAGDRLRSAGP